MTESKQQQPSTRTGQPKPSSMTVSIQEPPRRVIDEMLEGIALSMLIFLIADLRLMSATGRISTKFETIAIDSDFVSKTTSNVMAGIYEDQDDCQIASESNAKKETGLSPAQIMAVVLIELKRSLDAQKQAANKKPHDDVHTDNDDDDEEDEDEEDEDADLITAFAAAAPRRRRKRNAAGQAATNIQGKDAVATDDTNMHALLKAYAQMIATDLNHTVPYIEARQSMLQLSVGRRGDVDHSVTDEAGGGGVYTIEEEESGDANNENISDERGDKQDKEDENDLNKREDDKGDTGNQPTGATTPKDANFLGRAFSMWGSPDAKPAAIVENAQAHLAKANPVTRSRIQTFNQRRNSLMMNEQQKTQVQLMETTDALFNMAETDSNVRESLAVTQDALGSSLSEDFEESQDEEDGAADSGDALDSARPSLMSISSTNRPDPRSSNEKRLLKIMEKAVASREYNKLDFMAKFFQDGTISQLMVKSKARIVWVNDWFPIKDLTYALAVDTSKKRLLVVFRGAITKQDWAKAFDFSVKRVHNPIRESFPKKPKKIDLHSGFYQYLFRVRKDTGTTKYDEIANLAHKYGIERIGEDYQLVVTGHSLGGALSTLFGFFSSTDKRFTKNGPVKVFNFGSPYVGGHYFADAFRHQEQVGLLMMCRFQNHNDFVAYSPANFGVNKRGSTFRHVGIGINVPPVPRVFSSVRKWKPSVYYVGDEGFWKSYCRGIGRNFLLHSPFPWLIQKMHTLGELLQRLMEGSMRKEGHKAFKLLELPVEDLYRELAHLSPLQAKK